MGRPKLLLPWGATTVLGRLVEQWREMGARQITVVSASADAPLNAELDRLGIVPEHRVINPEPGRGMFSSIQCAARWNQWEPILTHIAIALGDQPHLASGTLRSVVRFASAHPEMICQPSHEERARHPVFVSKAAFQSLAETSARTLKEFLAQRRSEVRLIECKDPGLDFDMDTPADYERAQKLFFR
jgi:molybdenum cofactor cytidylyltransferase